MSNKGTIADVARNLLSGWVAIAIKGGIALVMVPFLLNHLGTEAYGLICLLLVIVGLSTIADFGLRAALIRELSERVAKEDAEGFREISSTALSLYLCIAAVVGAAGFVLAPWLVEVFKVGEDLRSIAIWLFRTYSIFAFFVSLITPVFAAGLTSFMRFDVVEGVGAGSAIISGMLLFALVPILPVSPLITWAAITLFEMALGTAVKYLFYRKCCFGGKLAWHHVKPARLKPLLSLGWKTYLLQMAHLMTNYANPLVLSGFLGTSAVALFKSASRVSEVLNPVVSILSFQLIPLTTRYHVQGQNDTQCRLCLVGSRFTMLLGSLMVAGMFVFAEPFCRLWLSNSLGEDYLVVVCIMQVVAVVDLTTFARGTQFPVLLGMNRLGFLMWVYIPTAIINLLLSIYLVGFTSLGINGVLYPTIGLALIRVPLITWHVSRLLGISLRRTLREAYAAPFACLVLTLLAAYGFSTAFICHTWLTLCLATGATTLVWSVLFILIGVTRDERVIIWNIVSKWRAHLNRCRAG